jgi:cellulose synthase/poly-beta-1,6-N-acetylglucosamine synthase-like glycosyltransferase
MVRRRLGSHAGFYAPVTALICPCQGIEPGLEDNLTALTRFEYANYEIYFSLATSLDPALKIIERVKAASQRPVHIVIAGPPEDCGEKVYNLRRAVEALPDQFEVLVFTDSDVRLQRGWLSK